MNTTRHRTHRPLERWGTLLAILALPSAVWAAGDEVALPAPFLALMLNLPAILLGIGLHEWAHAWTAWKLGDSTPGEEGRLSLNPLSHLDPVGTILIVVGIVSSLPVIGWGKPVMIRPAAFRKPIKDKMKVALAGPMMNLAIAGVALVLIHGLLFVFHQFPIDGPGAFWKNLYKVLLHVVMVNFSLAMFNMIPVPPLDGSKVLENFVGADTVMVLRQMEPYGILILLGLMQTGILDVPFGVMAMGIGTLLASAELSLVYLALASLAWWMFARSLRWFK